MTENNRQDKNNTPPPPIFDLGGIKTNKVTCGGKSIHVKVTCRQIQLRNPVKWCWTVSFIYTKTNSLFCTFAVILWQKKRWRIPDFTLSAIMNQLIEWSRKCRWFIKDEYKCFGQNDLKRLLKKSKPRMHKTLKY